MCCGMTTVRATEDCIGRVFNENGEHEPKAFKAYEEFEGAVCDTEDGLVMIVLNDDDGSCVGVPEGKVEWRVN